LRSGARRLWAREDNPSDTLGAFSSFETFPLPLAPDSPEERFWPI